MRKLKYVALFGLSAFLLTGCLVIPTIPGPVTGDLTVDHSVCQGSAIQLQFGSSSTSVLAVNETTNAAAAINACYGVGGQPYYYGASSFIYDRSDIDNEGKYTYYVVTSNSGILHRFRNKTTIVGDELSKQNVTVLTDGVYEITLDNGRRYDATYLGGYEEADVAVFSVRTMDSIPFVSVGSSDDLIIGQPVQAVGTPILGTSFINTVVQGVISGLNRRYSYLFEYEDYTLAISDHPAFQFDAPINYGMEGGPIFNGEGALIGMITYKYENEVESLSLGLPIDDVKEILNSIITSSNHTFTRVMMGVGVSDLDTYPQSAILLDSGARVTQGLYINEVSSGSPAANASPSGIQAGEIITGITLNSVYYPITNIAHLTGKLWRCKTGDTIGIETKVANQINTVILTKQYTLTF